MARAVKMTLFVLMLFAARSVTAQVTYVVPGDVLCECLNPENYLLLKRRLSVGNVQTTTYYANSEVLISFLGNYGLSEAHIFNLNYPNDLVVGIGDLSALLTGFNVYPTFDGTLCAWNVASVASHGWILNGANPGDEAYIHESSFDEFAEFEDADLGQFGSCDLNSFDLEAVYQDSVVKLTFAKRYTGGGAPD